MSAPSLVVTTSATYRSDFNFAVQRDSTIFDGMQAKHSSLRQVDDGSAKHRAKDTTITDGEGAAGHVFDGELIVACLRNASVERF